MATAISQLVADLKALGVAHGDILFIHASYKSLGEIENGPAGVIEALQQAVGQQGTIMMPSFNLVAHDQRAATWNIDITPATTGYLTEYFRQMPGTVRSDHYSHSVAARGAKATAFTKDHRNPQGLCSPWDKAPWGSTYGQHSPMHKAYDADGKILMIGTDHHASTYIHFVEVLLWNNRLQADPQVKYHWLDRPLLGQWWNEHGRQSAGKIGDAPCHLFKIRDYVDTLLKVVTPDPQAWRKRD